jgi:hypothetical protein
LQIRRPSHTWAGLRSFVPDGDMVIGWDAACSTARVRSASWRAAAAKSSPPDAYRMARDEFTMMGPSGRRPARTVATASPPCAPTPGISSGSVGAMLRTRSISWG